MTYPTGQSVCPQCGSSEQVHTVREIFDMMNGMREQASQRMSQLDGRPGPGPGLQGAPGDGDYDHYNVEGSDAQRGWGSPGGRRSTSSGYSPGSSAREDFGAEVAGAVISAAFGFAGRAIGRRMKRALDEKVVPAMQARTEQARRQWEVAKADQEAIVARYPELRGCLRDNVIFLDGGRRTVPVSDIEMPVTLTQADEVVARLR